MNLVDISQAIHVLQQLILQKHPFARYIPFLRWGCNSLYKLKFTYELKTTLSYELKFYTNIHKTIAFKQVPLHMQRQALDSRFNVIHALVLSLSVHHMLWMFLWFIGKWRILVCLCRVSSMLKSLIKATQMSWISALHSFTTLWM